MAYDAECTSSTALLCPLVCAAKKDDTTYYCRRPEYFDKGAELKFLGSPSSVPRSIVCKTRYHASATTKCEDPDVITDFPK